MSHPATQHDAPRFALGQRVRVIANAGGLYAAQIGVVGVISKQRQKRRYGYRSYDVTYMKPFSLPNEKGREKIVIVREDDLEAVDETPSAPTPDAPFRIGQRVTVRPPADDGAEDDEYPSFTRYPVVGEIASACLVTADGVHCYDVRFPRIERGVSTESWPPVSIREAHLMPEPSQVGWMAHAAAMARTKASQKTPARSPEKPQPAPKFSTGEHVTVHPHSALCYETFTRKGAVGVIVEIGKPVRGIRRYTVSYSTGVMTRIREEHLVKADAPAPPAKEPPAPDGEQPHDDGWGTWDDDAPLKAKEQVDDGAYTAAYGDDGDERPSRPARHAYEYRDQHPKGERLWCDAGGCFMDDCVVCEGHLPTPPQPRLSADVERRIKAAYQRQMDAAQAGDAHAFALEEVLRYATRGDSLASLQDHRGGGMGPCYAYEWHGDKFTVTAIGPGSLEETRCHHRFSVKKLYAEAQAHIAHAPQQASLWGTPESEARS